MSRHVAFLRAINVGGHVVKMERLVHVFESLGVARIETFLASGNVVFDSVARTETTLARRIESALAKALGYQVATFLRTLEQCAAISRAQPFAPARFAAASAFNVALLEAPLDAAAKRKVLTLRTDVDDFHPDGREVYWLCQRKQSDSTFSNAVLEKTLGVPSTLRGASTLRKLVAKHPSPSRS